jgi:hypothetical protein
MDLREVIRKYKQFKVPSLSEIQEKTSQHSKTSLVIIILLFALLLLALQYIPHYQVAQFNITNQKDLADAENSYRATLAQIFGGVAIAIGLYYTWRRIGIAEEDLKVTQENLEATQKVAQGNLKIAQEGQITERFTRAIDQLGSDKSEIRLGGIYALERIANESEKDYWPIMEILTAYVRKNSSIELTNQDRVSLDIQAILTIIGRCNYAYRQGKSNCLDLSKTNLKGVELTEAQLVKANLTGAHLEGTFLVFASLEETNLREVYFKGSSFLYASLKGADLRKAYLREVYGLSFDQLSKAKTLYKAELDPELEEELRAKGFGHLLDDEPK